MGGNQSEPSNLGIEKGTGYRVLAVDPNSPAAQKFDIYFDFIVDVISSKEPERNPKEILNKLAQPNASKGRIQQKKIEDIIAENENTPITLKVVSTKYRRVKNVEITPNKDWNEKGDLLGATLRFQRYDEALDTYFPFSDIKLNSPIKKAGIMEGEFLIGAQEFVYDSINGLLQNLYDRYFDKQIDSKSIHFAVYNINIDDLKIVEVGLARGWGDKGLLGCQFLEGHLNKFPKNFEEIREQIKEKKKKTQSEMKVKNQLSQINGTSLSLVQSLKSKRKQKKKRNLQAIKRILEIEPLRNEKNQESHTIPPKPEKQMAMEAEVASFSEKEFRALEKRVQALEQTVGQVRSIIENLEEDSEEEKV